MKITPSNALQSFIAVFVIFTGLSNSPNYAQSANNNMHLNVGPGDRRKLFESRASESWQNPMILINDKDLLVTWHEGKTKQQKTISFESLEKFLLQLPKTAWPYGRIAIWQSNGISSRSHDQRLHDRKLVQDVFKKLDIIENPVPSA